MCQFRSSLSQHSRFQPQHCQLSKNKHFSQWFFFYRPPYNSYLVLEHLDILDKQLLRRLVICPLAFFKFLFQFHWADAAAGDISTFCFVGVKSELFWYQGKKPKNGFVSYDGFQVGGKSGKCVISWPKQRLLCYQSISHKLLSDHSRLWHALCKNAALGTVCLITKTILLTTHIYGNN